MAIADLNGRGGTVGYIAIHCPVAVIHRSDKLAGAALLALALSLGRSGNTVARLLRR
jgi:hypothetical protein